MKSLSPGKNPPSEINVLIEIPQGGKIKYELDKETGIVFVDRFLYTSMVYPFNYGFIPQSKADDGDAVDVLVISAQPVQVGTVLPSKPIAMLEMEDEEGIDTKIIAVPTAKIDPQFGRFASLEDVPESLKMAMKHFFEHYKELEPGKWVKVKNWRGREEAEEEIRRGLK